MVECVLGLISTTFFVYFFGNWLSAFYDLMTLKSKNVTGLKRMVLLFTHLNKILASKGVGRCIVFFNSKIIVKEYLNFYFLFILCLYL